MNLKKLILLLFLISNFTCNSQTYIDILGNEYIVLNNEIQKKDTNNIYKYKNIILGKINHIDVVNPLQTLLFYKNQNTVVLLDRYLSEIQNIKLLEILPQIQNNYAGLANQNHLWLYDVHNNRVILYSILNENYRYITTNIEEEISWMTSNLNYLLFLTKQGKLYEVDIYGKINFIDQLPPNSYLEIVQNTGKVIDNQNKKIIFEYQIKNGKLEGRIKN